MGVGQHYNMAAWIGKGFGEMSQNVKMKDRTKPRNFIVKSIKISDLLIQKNVSEKILNDLIKEKPASNLYTGNSIISKESETKLKVDEIEKLSNHIWRLEDIIDTKEKAKKIKEILKFFTLQEARNIGIFNYLNNTIINYIYAKKEISLVEFKSNINYGYLLTDNTFNLNLINNLKQYIKDYSDKNLLKNEIFELSKLLFNELYPKIYHKKLQVYEDYRWIKIDIQNDTVGCSDLPLVNFSEPWHKYQDLNLFKYLPINYQNIIKESIVITLSKNKLLFGFNNKFKYKEMEELLQKESNLRNFINTIYPFVNTYMLFCSFDYFTITSEVQKTNLFSYIIENFDSINRLYNGNMKNRVKYIE